MLKRSVTVVLLLLGLAAGTASAQDGNGAVVRVVRSQQSSGVDVDRLPIDLNRVHRELREAVTVREERDGLNLRYEIQVFGRAPEIRLFTPADNLTTGPVPYGAPTHQEIIRHITPKEFSSPVMDFNGLFRWLAEKAKN
jgi:hypothetical protein